MVSGNYLGTTGWTNSEPEIWGKTGCRLFFATYTSVSHEASAFVAD